jgi:hypothetical protein
MIVDHLTTTCRNSKNIGVACIYFNHKEVDIQTPSKLLAGLWRQLVLNREIGSDATDLYGQHYEKNTQPLLQEVAAILRSSLKGFSKVFVVVDAMDECPELQREVLIQHLRTLGSNVNLMITSRPNISPETFSLPYLERLDIEAVPRDIQGYIDAQIKLSPRLSTHVHEQPILREEISTKIIGTVDGM